MEYDGSESSSASLQVRDQLGIGDTPGQLEIVETAERVPAGESAEPEASIRLLKCSDRETEIKTVAKEVKRLVLFRGYRLAEITLRGSATHSKAIARSI